jgi:hypothetical protein
MSDPICAVLGMKKHDSKLLNSLDTLLLMSPAVQLEAVLSTLDKELEGPVEVGPGAGLPVTPSPASAAEASDAMEDSAGGGASDHPSGVDSEPESAARPGARDSDCESDREVVEKGLEAATRAFATAIASRGLWTAKVAAHQLSLGGGTVEVLFGFDGYCAGQRATAASRGSKAKAKLQQALEHLRTNDFKEGP